MEFPLPPEGRQHPWRLGQVRLHQRPRALQNITDPVRVVFGGVFIGYLTDATTDLDRGNRYGLQPAQGTDDFDPTAVISGPDGGYRSAQDAVAVLIEKAYAAVLYLPPPEPTHLLVSSSGSRVVGQGSQATCLDVMVTEAQRLLTLGYHVSNVTSESMTLVSEVAASRVVLSVEEAR